MISTYIDVLALVDIEGVIHEMEFDDLATVVKCTGREPREAIWNPNHPGNTGRPRQVTCLLCLGR